MKLSDVPTADLHRMLLDAEAAAGQHSRPVAVLRREFYNRPDRHYIDMTQPDKQPRARRTRAEIQASQIDDLVAGLRALNPDDIVTLGHKLTARAPRTAALLFDAITDREKDLGKEPPAVSGVTDGAGWFARNNPPPSALLEMKKRLLLSGLRRP